MTAQPICIGATIAMPRMIEVISGLITAAPEAQVGDVGPSGFMVAALLRGSVRVVMEAGASEYDLACLRRELSRACRAYLAVAN